MAPEQSLLVTTSRRIGSVLGKIVATTEQSLARKQTKLLPKKRTSTRRSRKASVKRGTTKSSNMFSERNGNADSLRHSLSMYVRRGFRAKRLAARNARSYRE
jgi:hypothetical protein